MGEWISVKDRLPEKMNDVLVYGPAVGIGTCYLSTDDFYDTKTKIWYKKDIWYISDSEEGNYLDFETVTHWMPLPEPPKVSDDGK